MTAERTASARASRETAIADASSWRAFDESMPIPAKVVLLPSGLTYGVLAGLSIGTFAAVTAALASFAYDDLKLVMLQALGAALVATASGTGLAVLVRLRDADAQRPGDFSVHGTRWSAVVLACIVAVAAMAWFVSDVRATGSRSDAASARQDVTNVVVPGAPRSAPAEPSPPEPSGVSRWTWLAYELAVGASAFAMKYLRADPRAARGRSLARSAKKSQSDWDRKRAVLRSAIGDLESAVANRANRDVAAALVGEAQTVFATARVATYRRNNGAARVMAGDPFDDWDVEVPTLLREFSARPGTDTRVLTGPSGDDRDSELLSAGYHELEQSIAPNDARPGRDLRLDSWARAVDEAAAEPGTRVLTYHGPMRQVGANGVHGAAAERST